MIDFPASPSVGQNFSAAGVTWTWDGAKWTATGLNVPYLPLAGGTLTGPLTLAGNPVNPLDAVTKQYSDGHAGFRNRIINGDMSVDQRNGGNLNILTVSGYAIDRWKCTMPVGSKGSVGQIALIAAGIAATGYLYQLQWATQAAYTPVTADAFQFYQVIEGYNFNDAQFGTANAQPVVLEFWAAATVAGTYAGSLRNGAGNRSYVFTYTLAANTWTKVRVAIPGDTAGTWSVAANASAASLAFTIGSGATYQTAPNVWTAGNFISAPGSINVVGTLNAVLNITGVAVMVGAAAASAEPEFRKYSDNQFDCQRYYNRLQLLSAATVQATGGLYATAYGPPMRTSATVAVIGTNNSANVTGQTFGPLGPLNGVYSSASAIATGSTNIGCTVSADADF